MKSSNGNNTYLYATPGYETFTKRVAEAGSFPIADFKYESLAEGLNPIFLPEQVVNSHAVIIGSPLPGLDMEMSKLMMGVQYYGALSLTVVIPYHPWATAERAARSGEIPLFATYLKALEPFTNFPLGSRLFLLDLHVAGTENIATGFNRAKHLYLETLILRLIEKAAAGREYILGAPDGGRLKWVQSYARKSGVDIALILKRHTGDGNTVTQGLTGNPRDQHVVIYDDLTRSGSTIVNAADDYIAAGATGISVVLSHAALTEGAYEKLEACPHIDAIYTTDTHPRAIECEGKFLKVVSAAPEVAAVIGHSYPF